MKKLTLLLAVICLLALATTAMADVTTIDDPYSIGSWSQLFNESGVGNFDQMQLQWISGAQFEPPSMTGLAPGWALSLDNGINAIANGPATTNMNFNINFLGASSQPLSFNFWALYNGGVKESVQINWSGSRWTYSPNQQPAPAVPEPMSMALGFMGLSTLAGYAKLRRRKA